MITDNEFTRRMVRTVFTVTAIVIVLAALYAARAAVMLIYISALVAMGFAPIVTILEQRRDGRPHGRGRRILAIATLYFFVVIVAVLLGLMVVPTLLDQAERLWSAAPRRFSALQTFLIQHHLMTRRVTLAEAVQNAPAGATGNTVTTVFFALWSVVGGVFGAITTLILSFYLLIEAEALFAYLIAFVPTAHRGTVAAVASEIVRKVSAWLRAQFLVAGVMGVFAAVGLVMLQAPYFYVVALVAAVGETIPIVGPIAAGITAVVIAASASPRLAIEVGAYFLVLHQLEANVLVPKIMERGVGVSPVTVIIALLIGVELWGLLGAILAIPTAAILSVVLEEFARAPQIPGSVAS